MKPHDWTSTPYSPEDAPEAARLARDVWGDVDAADASYLEWQYSRNPAGAVIAQLAREGSGRVVAQYVTVPVRVAVDNREYKASIGLNVATDPAYRGRGVFPSLAREVNERSAAEGVAFTYAFPNQLSFPGFVKRFGFREVGRVPLLVRVVNLKRLVARRTGRAWLGALAMAAAPLLARDLRRQRPRVPANAQVERVERFGREADDFWQRLRGREPVMVVRDAAYLNWRFSGVPRREYAAFQALVDGSLAGYAVLRCTDMRGVAAGLIVDFVVEAGERGEEAGQRLLDEALSFFAARDLDLLGSLALPHTPEHRLLRSAGFRPTPRLLEPQPFRLVARWHGPDVERAPSLYDPRCWLITMGDYDIG